MLMSKTSNREFIFSASVHVMCPSSLMSFCELNCSPGSYKHKALHLHQKWQPWSHTPYQQCSICICMCTFMFMSVYVLGGAGLADSCIIFGSAPSLWRASSNSAGSLRLPLSGSGSPAKPGRAGSLTAAAHNPLRPAHGPAPKTLCYTQMARLLTGSEVSHFHWRSACRSRGFPPLWKETLWWVLQYCIHVWTALRVQYSMGLTTQYWYYAG